MLDETAQAAQSLLPPLGAVPSPRPGTVSGDPVADAANLLMLLAGTDQWPLLERDQKVLLRRAKTSCHPDVEARLGHVEIASLYGRARAVYPLPSFPATPGYLDQNHAVVYPALAPADLLAALWDALAEAAERLRLSYRD